MDIKDILFSASSLKTYKQCGRKFYFYRIEKREPTHEPYHYGWVGTIVHNCVYYSIADYNDEEWKVSGIKPLTKVNKFFDDLWDGTIELDVSKQLVEDEEIKPNKPIFKPDSMKEKKYLGLSSDVETQWRLLAKDLLFNGYRLIVDLLKESDELLLEKEIRFKYNDVIDVVGYVDILVKPENGKWRFYDLKTSRQAPRSVDNDLQFYFYKYGIKKLFDLDYEPDGHFVHLRTGKLVKSSKVKKEIVEGTEKEILELLDGISNGSFLPNLYSPLCAFCDFRGYCYGDDGSAIIGKYDDKVSLVKGIDESKTKGNFSLFVYTGG